MSLLHIEGFESFGTSGSPVGFSRKYSTGGTGTIVTGHTGGFAWRTGGTSVSFTISDTGNPQTIVLGFGFKISILKTESIIFFRSGSPIRNNIVLKIKINGALEILRSTTVLGTTSAGLIVADTPYYIELKTKIDNTTGSFDLRIDKISVLSDSNIDTLDGAADPWTNHFIFRGANGAFISYDDFYILDLNGSENNNFLDAAVVVVASYPNAAGDETDWTPDTGSNFERVNENPTDDDVSFVEATTGKDLHNYDDLSLSGTIHGIQINTEVRDTIGGGSNLKTLVKSGGTLDTGPLDSIAGTSYEYHTRILEQDPNTSAAWQSSAINAIQAGYEVG